MEENKMSAIAISDLLRDMLNKTNDLISDLESIKINVSEEDFEDLNPVIDSIIGDNNNHLGKLQQLIDMLSGDGEIIEDGKYEAIELIDNSDEFMESMTTMSKKLKLNENFDNVIDDVQAVADPVFVGANKEHDENKKKYEDAIKENKKEAEDTIPKEGETGDKVSSKELKAMKLSEALFDESLSQDFIEWCGENIAEYILTEFVDLKNSDIRQVLKWVINYFSGPDFEESLKEDLDFNEFSDFNSAIYNAIGDVMFRFRDKDITKNDLDKALEWFDFHFWEVDADDMEESLKESLDFDDYSDFNSAVYNALADVMFSFSSKNVEKADLDKALEWFDTHFWEFDGDEFETRKMNHMTGIREAVDLSKIDGTITKTLQDNVTMINKCKSANELYKVISEILDSAHIDTKYSRKFLDKLSKMRSFAGALQYVYNIILSGSGEKVITESYVAEWWGQVDEDTPQKVAKRYNLNVKPLKQKSNEILYKFEGNLEDFSRAIDDGYFYSLTVQQDAGHSDDIDSLLYESLQYKIAKEQIQRFTEGKMPKNWSVNGYLKKLTENKHITHKEARSLKEWYNTRTKLNESFDWKKSSGNGYLYGYDGSAYTGVVQPNGHSYILERTFSGNDKVIWTKDFNSVEEGRKAVDFVRDKLSKRPLSQKDYEAIEEADKELAQW